MRRLIVNILIVVLAGMVLTGCITVDFGSDGFRSVRGNGDLTSQERTVSGIERISLQGIGEVEITLGDSESLVIEAEENLLDYLETEVDNGVLELRTRNLINLRPTKDIRYIITVTSINGLEVLGSGNITLDRADTTSMRLVIAGSGDINVDELTAVSLDVTIPGSGEINLSGEVDHQDINIAGSGKYMAEDLLSHSADISLAGSGNMRIWVTDQLDVRILGSGDIRYYGTPSIKQSIVGSGNIVSLGEK